MLTQPPLVIDTGIVSRYGFTGRFDILEALYTDKIIIPSDVVTECVKVSKMQTPLTQALSSGWLKQFSINYVDHTEIFTTFASLTKQFGPGESAVMAIAKINGYTVGCDDMAAARKFCERNQIPLMGSLGILYDAVNNQILSAADADLVLNDMVSKSSYRSPVKNFSEVVGWFKNKKGKKLY
ncbi:MULTISPECIES: hypothetical protein [Priestia]|uniref:Uncharacterized protein n=2 Tax=Priestia TaxID=2800373 RepID=A0A0V8JS82_9BACI|nr:MULTISPECIES: hypothetical protein [Priestia]KSU89800.1 hypothetical protein AS180_00065 [Priestia veravalensis]MBN8253928.1 hypothetical protein [Priestia flexa]SCB73674.1 Predicted nucleic acid-binding protein, contains PIN domain [Priestia flexa]